MCEILLRFPGRKKIDRQKKAAAFPWSPPFPPRRHRRRRLPLILSTGDRGAIRRSPEIVPEGRLFLLLVLSQGGDLALSCEHPSHLRRRSESTPELEPRKFLSLKSEKSKLRWQRFGRRDSKGEWIFKNLLMFASVREGSFRAKYELGIRQLDLVAIRSGTKNGRQKNTTIRLPYILIATHFTSTPLAFACALLLFPLLWSQLRSILCCCSKKRVECDNNARAGIEGRQKNAEYRQLQLLPYL